MNLYALHSNPESLYGYEKATEQVPLVAWEFDHDDRNKIHELEHLWTQDAELSYLYAYQYLKNKFPLGEPAIAKDPKWSYEYAFHVLSDWELKDMKRFPLGEKAIATHPYYSFAYALDILKRLGIKGFPLGEPAIAKDPEWSYEYADEVLDGRFLLGEPTIRDSDWREAYEERFGVEL